MLGLLRRRALPALLSLAAVRCATPVGSATEASDDAGDLLPAPDASPSSPSPDAGIAEDAGPAADAATPPPDAGEPPSTDDGAPTRQPCTNRFGSALTRAHGRLDGYLVSVVQPGASGCNADVDHLHLQVRVQGSVYDVAVNVNSNQTTPSDVYFAETDMTLPGGAWSEGWHPNASLDYVALGLHSGDFTAVPEAQLAQRSTAALQDANHVSIFATGYGRDGVHLVHRNAGEDGAVIVEPLSARSHLLLYRFRDQSF